MRDRYFFLADPRTITATGFLLQDAESHHARRVLKFRLHEEIWATDGEGKVYQGTVERITGNTIACRIKTVLPEFGEPPVRLELGLALIKRECLELAVEKAVELGVTRIQPLLLDRCNKRDLNSERLQKLIQTACKQTGRSRCPGLSNPVSLETWLEMTSGSPRLVCHPSGELTLTGWLDSAFKSGRTLHFLVGPEGDFSPRELDLLQRAQVNFITLGDRRLRSETAAITILAVINEWINRRETSDE